MKSARLLVCGAVALSTLLLPARGVSAAGAVPGCGRGLDLVYSPPSEAYLASVTGGNVNGDGYVCFKVLNDEARPSGIIIDNRVGGPN